MRCQSCQVNEGPHQCDICGKALCKSCLFWDIWSLSCVSQDPGWYCSKCRKRALEGKGEINLYLEG